MALPPLFLRCKKLFKISDESQIDTPSRLAIIIPAFDESATVASVITQAKQSSADCHVFVVDDCSSDNTGRLAGEAGATVLTMPYRAGAWNSVQAALLYAMKSGDYDFYITLDADGQHHPGYIPTLVDHARRNNIDLVIGSCPERGSVTRKIAWSFFAALTRLGIRDMTSGFRGYSREAVQCLLSKEATLLDYQDLGVLLLLRRHGFRCSEVSVPMEIRADGCSRVFHSWWAVMSYIVKTCIWVLFDWIQPKASSQLDSWKEYDSI